jgi:hypothetical protein
MQEPRSKERCTSVPTSTRVLNAFESMRHRGRKFYGIKQGYSEPSMKLTKARRGGPRTDRLDRGCLTGTTGSDNVRQRVRYHSSNL